MSTSSPIRSVGLVIHRNKILVIWRSNRNRIYYVIPGGKVEPGESLPAAAIREVFEETSIKIEIVKHIFTFIPRGNSKQYFYLAKYISGKPRLGDFNEKQSMARGSSDLYRPMWISLAKLAELRLYPTEIKQQLAKSISCDFKHRPVTIKPGR